MLKQLFFKRTFNKWMARYEKDPHPSYVLELITLLMGQNFTHYNPSLGLKMTLLVQFSNVGELFTHLESANLLMIESEFIRKSLSKQPTYPVKLDDYLVTHDDIPLKIEGVIKRLHSLYITHYEVYRKKEMEAQHYYKRHFESINHEIVHLIQCFFTLLD